MTRLTSPSTAGQTYRTNLYNDLRTEAKASSYLFAFEQSTPDLTLKVSPGQIYFGTTLVEYAGGNSPSFTAPTTHPRIDILSINSSGTLVRTAGDEGSTPTAPDVPVEEIPIAQVYNRVGQTSIKDADDSTNGYIQKDLRPFITLSKEPETTVYTSNNTYIPSAGVKYIEVEVCGGGGAGEAGQAYTDYAGGGGGAGGYARKLVKRADLGSSVTVTVGAGGTGGSSAGESGSTSSFGTHCSASGGGGGGVGGAGSYIPDGGAGGSGSSGDINITGGGGGAGQVQNAKRHSGTGGSSFFGGGGRGRYSDGTGYSGGNYGGGGGGGCRTGSTTRNGGSGGSGVVIVKEFFN